MLKKAITTNAWRREWEVASHDMAPSRPLSLLTEPANINLKSHTRKARRVFLSHFDADNEPQGRLTQRLREEERERKIIEQYLEVERDTEIERRRRLAKEREKVKLAAHTAEVIDLTKDDLADFVPTWEILPADDADKSPLPFELEFWNPICSFDYPSGQLEQEAVFSSSGASSAQRRPTSQATGNLDEPQVHAYPDFLPQELDFGSLFDQDLTTEMLHGYQDYHFPWGQ
ncbi:hypothetical protein N0V83_009139 [Neocucurbitaria cava]|uniref:Uncharacterized protein n=1 Tax=Neocucurbitaria cava TaxID=798079 RepID=A0A9W9CIN2_9PLEO|nr:hypothetical protein N0V83_009139 [Neocucurbitaria cava]